MLKRFLNKLSRVLEFFTAASMGILVIDVSWQVITRFILKAPSDFTEELATFLMIWVGLLGAAVAYNRKAHLGIDYFVAKFNPRNRLIAEGIVNFMVLFFSVSVLFYGGIQLVVRTFSLGQASPALGLPLGFVYLCVPVSGFFLTLYSIEYLLETIHQFKSN
ncbi:MAG: TRAP transporter small permease [candidate division KSB1 bacterium]|nr:TRAP transporter small permease [candidate division KSB1 bacterium]